MKRTLVAATLACFAAASAAPTLASGGASQPAGYACLASPKAGPVKVVLTPPPPGFKCPTGQKLFLVTKQMQDKASGAFQPELDAPEPPEPTPPPGLVAPPKKKAPKKTQPKNPNPIPPGGKACVPDGLGGLYCCYSLSDCRCE